MVANATLCFFASDGKPTTGIKKMAVSFATIVCFLISFRQGKAPGLGSEALFFAVEDDQTALPGPHRELDAVAKAGLQKKRGNVVPHRVDGDDKLLGDFVVGEPSCDVAEDLDLALGELVAVAEAELDARAALREAFLTV